MTDWDKATYEADYGTVNESAALSERLERLENENETLKETLSDVALMFRAEDAGWALIGGLTTGDRLEGLDLDEVHQISEAIRPHIVGDSLVKRGVDLHSGYNWNKGLNIDGALRKSGTRGAGSKLQGFYANAVNQASIFSSTAHQELQKARYSDGNIFLACDTSAQTVRRIPLNQIKGVKVNPEFPEEVWAYLREWDPKTEPNGKPEKRWYYTTRFTGTKVTSYKTGSETIAVAENTVIVDKRFNRQIGYPLGIPDAVAAMPWIAAYTEIMQYGRVVNESLAKMLYKVVSRTKTGAQNAAVRIAGMTGAGNTASMVEGQDVQAIGTAGKGYDFLSARPVAAQAAAALNVPNAEFLSDSSAAGSSYGALSALTPSTKNTMRLMQAEWIEMYLEVFAVFSISTSRIWFDPLEDVDPYRAAQSLTLLSPTLSDEEYRGKALDYLDIAGEPNKIPETLKARTAAAKQAASPDQGVSNGTNSAGQGANDLRTDNIGESLRRQMVDEDFLERLEALVDRLETAGK